MYAYSNDEECYVGEFDTPEAAAAEAFADTDIKSVWVGEVKHPLPQDFVNGYGLLEDVSERADDECGEWSGEWLSDTMCDKAKIAELEKLVGDWIQAQEPPTFWTVLNPKQVKRGDQ